MGYTAAMRFVVGVLVLVVFVVAGYFLLQPGSMPSVPPGQVAEPSYASARHGFSFSHPDAYELAEFDAPGSGERAHHVITLMRKADLPVPQNGEEPPMITIDIYQNNLDNQTAEDWIRNDSRSNFKLGEGRLSTTVGGEEALSYRWSGLYEGTTIVVAKPEWMYAFSVTYLEPGADIVQDFVTVRDSIRFSTGDVE